MISQIDTILMIMKLKISRLSRETNWESEMACFLTNTCGVLILEGDLLL